MLDKGISGSVETAGGGEATGPGETTIPPGEVSAADPGVCAGGDVRLKEWLYGTSRA